MSQQVCDDAVVSGVGVCSAKCVCKHSEEKPGRAAADGHLRVRYVRMPVSVSVCMCSCPVRPTSSVIESREDVASSYRRMGGFFSTARAMATRCFSPPETKQQMS